MCRTVHRATYAAAGGSSGERLQLRLKRRMLMKVRWIGLSCVVVAALAIVLLKQHTAATAESGSSVTSSVLLVADLGEADETGDGCSAIIGAVRAAKAQGVKVEEFMPDSPSPLLKKYQVVSAPTVVIIGKDGREAARF